MNDDATWEKGWDGHEIEQLRRLSRLTLAEKVQWLEDAAHLSARLSRSAREAAETAADETVGARKADEAGREP